MADDNTLDKAIDLFYEAAVDEPLAAGDCLGTDEIAKGIAAVLDDLTESGRLLPPGGEVSTEWVMRWRHPSSSHLDQTPNFGSERRARQAALSCAKYGGVDVSVHRRDVHVWSDGTHLIGPWSPVVSDNKEGTDG